MKFFVYYLLIINIFTFFLFWTDKKKAQAHRWRISELTLILFSFLGGSLGALLGMYLFRHKTKKLKFLILVPVSLVFDIIAIYYIFLFASPA